MARKWLVAVLVAAVVGLGASAALAQTAHAEPNVNMAGFSWLYVIQKAFLGSGTIGFLDITLLILCSITIVALIIQFALEIRRTTMLPELTVAQVKTMFDERRFREALEFCQNDPSFVAAVIRAGLMEAANGYAAMEKSMVEAAEERASRLFRKVELLNLLGNITPMLGLFGTVYGMMIVFSMIANKGGMAQASDLGAGIMVKLFCTFMGLVGAIPALSAYSLLKSRIDALAVESTMVASELLANFKPNKARQQKEEA
jgi:biopolymer transport protein ExbB